MFKRGDKVRIKSAGYHEYWYANRIGEVFTLGAYCEDDDDWEVEEDNGYIATCDIELFSQFYLKKNPWFIRINSEVEFDCVQNWLEDNFGRGVGCDYHGSIKMVTNTDCMGNIYSDDPMWGDRIERDFTCHEIILEFETVVKSVTYPVVEVEAEQDKKIKELKETIDKAQQQLEELMSK